MATEVLGASGLAVFAVVDEVLTHSSTSHRSDVLQRSRVGGGGGDDNRLVHNAVLLEGLHDAGNRRGLLANSDIDADHVVVFLVDNGIDRNSSLAGLAVANDELALATADRNHRVNSDDTGLHGLMHGLAADNARSLELDGAIAVGLNGAFAVDGHAKRVHNAAEKTLARRHFHDLAGGANLIVLSDCRDIAEEHSADFLFLKVLGQAVHGLAALTNKLEELAGHGALQAVDASNTVANLDDRTDLACIDARVEGLQLFAQRFVDRLRGDFSH